MAATAGTAAYLKSHGIRTHGENPLFGSSQIRRCAVENGVTMLTALDTVRVLLDVLEEITLGISTIDA